MRDKDTKILEEMYSNIYSPKKVEESNLPYERVINFLDIVLPYKGLLDNTTVDDILEKEDISPEMLDMATALELWQQYDEAGFGYLTLTQLKEYLRQAGYSVDEIVDIINLPEVSHVVDDERGY